MSGEAELRKALDDLWSCIGLNQIADLDEQTIAVAKANHIALWHVDPPQPSDPRESH